MVNTPDRNDAPTCGGGAKRSPLWVRVLFVVAVVVFFVWLGVAHENPAAFFGAVLLVALKEAPSEMWRKMVVSLTDLVQPQACRTCTS